MQDAHFLTRSRTEARLLIILRKDINLEARICTALTIFNNPNSADNNRINDFIEKQKLVVEPPILAILEKAKMPFGNFGPIVRKTP